MKVLPTFIPPDTFYVLVSGGVDSIAAAHWLKFAYRKDFTVVHFNHNVQTVNNDMEKAVRAFCNEFNLPCISFYNTNYGCFTEKDLREWRLSVMAELTGHFVTGHHLNDAVENYLANCFTGCPEHKPIQELTQFKTFSIYHPFITTEKASMQGYIAKNDLVRYVVTDPTNENTKYRRNWLRHNIIPEINSRNLGLEKIVLNKFYK
jgi:tRNA(Ile)-lysidine synthase